MQLSAGQLMEVSGISHPNLNTLCTNEVLNPTNNHTGQGRGNHRQFSLMDCVAVVYGMRMRDEGFHPVAVRDAIEMVANMTEKQLQKHFAEGETFLWPIPGQPQWAENPITVFDRVGKPMTLDVRATMNNIDLGNTYRAVLNRLKYLQEEAVANNGYQHEPEETEAQ